MVLFSCVIIPKSHQKSATIVFSSKVNKIHICATVKEQIWDKVFNILYTISLNIHGNRDTASSTPEIYTNLYKQRKADIFEMIKRKEARQIRYAYMRS